MVTAILGEVVLAAFVLGCGTPDRSAGETRSTGEIAFRSSCRTCHTLPRPSKHTDEEWPRLVEKYGRRANLPDSVIAQITIYLTARN